MTDEEFEKSLPELSDSDLIEIYEHIDRVMYPFRHERIGEEMRLRGFAQSLLSEAEHDSLQFGRPARDLQAVRGGCLLILIGLILLIGLIGWIRSIL